MSTLRVVGLYKSFPTSRGPQSVLDNVGFELPTGTLACLLGANGSGKTTLLKTIATLLSPDAGTVFLDNRNAHTRPEETKRHLGFASTEDQSFYGRLSARMNLWFYGQMYGLSRETFEKRLSALDKLLGLGDSLDRPYRELSSGQKQRYLLARADLHNPSLLVLDEPHQNLDPLFAPRLRDVIRNAWCATEGKTVLISTHHLEDAFKISDRWIVLDGGRVVFDGSVSRAMDERGKNQVETFFASLVSPS